MAAAPESMLDRSPGLRLRAMRDVDTAAVIAIERASYQFPWSEAIFRDCLRVGYVCQVAVIDERLVGYSIMSTGAGEAHVLNLCVDPGERCRGIGGRLLDALLVGARDKGTRDVFLEVRPSNTAAIRLYQSFGFQQIGLRRGYYQAAGGREDAVVLKRESMRSTG
jgi:ribosomal-protein-alanine N-acetyltransferase